MSASTGSWIERGRLRDRGTPYDCQWITIDLDDGLAPMVSCDIALRKNRQNRNIIFLNYAFSQKPVQQMSLICKQRLRTRCKLPFNLLQKFHRFTSHIQRHCSMREIAKRKNLLRKNSWFKTSQELRE